jgi:hypothetical protein
LIKFFVESTEDVSKGIEEEFIMISRGANLAATFPSFANRFLDKQIVDVKGKAIESIYADIIEYDDLLIPGPGVYPFPLIVL